uniref:TetR_C_7 domain-containing protein n=1 Tax=Parastrongyloides trichosuri TaxID=131310 RepID=A0A0N5A4E4_PARTI
MTERSRFESVAIAFFEQAEGDFAGPLITALEELKASGDLTFEKASWAAGQLMGMVEHPVFLVPMVTGGQVRTQRAPERSFLRPQAAGRPGVRHAIEPQPIMQAERTVAPELDLLGHDAPAGPAIRTRHLLAFEPSRLFGHPGLQRLAASQGPRLVGRPGADAAFPRPAGEVGAGLLGADALDRAAHPDLAAQALPVKQQSGGGMRPKLLALGAFLIGEEGEAPRIDILQQHHAHIGHALGVDRGQSHGVRIIRLAAPGFFQPFGKQADRLIPIKDRVVSVGRQLGGVVVCGGAGRDHRHSQKQGFLRPDIHSGHPWLTRPLCQ